jgi:outer membrane autotransporter protein
MMPAKVSAQDFVITLASGETNLNSPASYPPEFIPPEPFTDILLSAANTYPATLEITGTTVTGTINDANALPLTIVNTGPSGSIFALSATPGSNNTAGTGAGSVDDVLYVAAGSNLTFSNGVNPFMLDFATVGNVDNAGTLAIASNVGINPGTTVTFTGGGTTMVSGSIGSTTGAIAVDDVGGHLILSGTNAYSGGTTINGGALAVGSGGALGTGSVTNNSVLETTATPFTGNAGTAPLTIHVLGNYTQTAPGTLLLQVASSPVAASSRDSGVAGTNYDTVAVDGTATLSGVLDLHFATATIPTQGQRFVTLTAGAPLTSEFSHTLTNLPTTFFTVTTYNDTFGGTEPVDSAIVTLIRPFTYGGLTENQVSVARNVDRNIAILNGEGALAMPTGAQADFFNNIVTGLNEASLSSVSLGQALDQLSPQRYEVLRNVAFDNYALDVQSLDDEFARERDGQGGIDTSGFAFNDSALGSQLSQIDSTQSALGGVQMSDSKEMKPMTPEQTFNNWNGFIDGGVDLADLDHNDDVSHANYTTGRVRGGIDYLVTQDFRVGAMFGYGHTDADLDEEGSKAHIDSYTPGIYATYADKKGFYANGLFTYTRNDYSLNRNIIIPGVNRSAYGSPSGDQFGGDLDGGYEFHKGNWTFGPSAGLTYVNLGIDSFDEGGASAADLSVKSQSVESFRSRLGGTVRYDAKIGSVVVTPHVSAFWQHEFLDGSDAINSQFENLPGGSFSVQTVGGDSDNALLGFGIDADVTNSLTVFVDYDTEAGGSTFFGQSATGGLKVNF